MAGPWKNSSSPDTLCLPARRSAFRRFLGKITTIAARFGPALAQRFQIPRIGERAMRRRHFLLATVVALAVPTTAWATTGKPDARCLRLAARIAELRLKLRMGYTARQGRLYRQKLAALETERRELCR